MVPTLFCSWDRCSWHLTAMPVGMCLRRTHVDSLLTFWPPALSGSSVNSDSIQPDDNSIAGQAAPTGTAGPDHGHLQIGVWNNDLVRLVACTSKPLNRCQP